MSDQIRFFLNRLGERLWVKPAAVCILSIAGAFVSKGADFTELGRIVPSISGDSINTLLSIMSSSMLVIATFSVASMVSAYASASSTATPRSFALVVADDVSQNALSTFIGAFIFSIVSLIALENGYYDKAGRFTLFALTLMVFAFVILTFVRWVDRVARLGRLETTVDKVESVTTKAMQHRRKAPMLNGVAVAGRQAGSTAVYSERTGYVQRIDIDKLQAAAEAEDLRIELVALPGTFAAPGRALAFAIGSNGATVEFDHELVFKAFIIGDNRTFDEDPRFGLIALSEIASRALSPGINDPGTAIDVIGTLVRLFEVWVKPVPDDQQTDPIFDRVAVPEIALEDMFDDAFTAIARDAAGTIEVVVRLQKAMLSLASLDDPNIQQLARVHSQRSLKRAESTLTFEHDLGRARSSAEDVINNVKTKM